MLARILLALWLSLFPSLLLAQENTTNDSFQTAKHMLSEVYKDHRITFYCGVEYSEHGEIRLPDGFSTPKYENRATRMEWEHSVPAEAFGRNFPEWKRGGWKHTEFLNVEVELGDVIIRIMDAAKKKGWRVAEAVVAKAEYNKTRPFKHGGKEF